MRKDNILITGASGFIGKNLIDFISNHSLYDDYNFYLACRDISKIDNDLSNFNFFQGNLCDKKYLNSLTEKVDVVIHLAGMRRNREFHERYPGTLLSVNNRINNNVISFVVNNDVKKFITTSSVVVYERSSGVINENSSKICCTKVPNRGYAWSKRFLEINTNYFTEEKNINSIVFRLDNTYGPYNKFNDSAQLIPSLIRKIFFKKEIEVDKKDPTKKTFVYVKDVVRALLKSIEWGKNGCNTINISNFDPVSVEELINIIGDKLGIKPIIKYKNLGYHNRMINSRSDFYDFFHLNYDLDEGLEETISFFKENNFK